MKFLRLLALVLALMLIPTTAHAADAERKYGTGYFTVTNAQMPASGCIAHPYVTTVNIDYQTDGWFVDITVYDSAGAVTGGFVSDVYWSDWGTSTFDDTVTLCTGVDPSGTYQIVGNVHTVNNGSSTVVAQSLVPASFNVAPYVAPAPPAPAPAPAPTYANVTGSVKHKYINNGAKLTLKSFSIPSGTTVGKKLTWTVLADGKVKKTITQGPSQAKTIALRFKDRSGRHVIKVLRNGKVVKTVRVRA